MKIIDLLLLGAAGFGAWYLFNHAQSAANLQIDLSDAGITNINDITIDLLMSNTGNAPVQINSLAADVTVNGDLIASVSDFTGLTIPANSQKTATVHAKPNILQLPTAIRDLVNSNTNNYVFNLKGNVNLNGAQLPIDITKQITV
jgi:LEA14-like dessication related protein